MLFNKTEAGAASSYLILHLSTSSMYKLFQRVVNSFIFVSDSVISSLSFIIVSRLDNVSPFSISFQFIVLVTIVSL